VTRPKSLGIAPGWYRPAWWHPYDRQLGLGFTAALRALYGTRTGSRVAAMKADTRAMRHLVRRGLRSVRWPGAGPGR
jgi:hypothetical protein